jgi:hypothetical protein
MDLVLALYLLYKKLKWINSLGTLYTNFTSRITEVQDNRHLIVRDLTFSTLILRVEDKE